MAGHAFKTETKAERFASSIRGRRVWKRKLPGGSQELRCPRGYVIAAEVRESGHEEYPFYVDAYCIRKSL